MSKPILAEFLGAVKARCEHATPGPWTAEGPYIAAAVEGGRPNGEVIGRMEASADHLCSVEREANAELVAHAPTDLKALVGLVEEMRRGLEYETDPGNNEEGPVQQAANAAQFLNELEALVPETS